jgi:hypothetical protein
MARSLADQATDLDRLAEDAALFGKVLVDTALNLYTPQQQ